MNYRVIKENDMFFLTDEKGNIPKSHPYGLGLYTKDTRFLSEFSLRINGEEPVLLSSDASENYMATILLTNPPIEKDGEIVLWRESVQIERKRFIYSGVLYETVKLKNYFPKPVTCEISVSFDADFADMFIIRGFQTGKVGKRTGQTVDGNSLVFHYEGADGVYRATTITWDRPAILADESGQVVFAFSLHHDEEQAVTFMIQPQIGQPAMPKTIMDKDNALRQLQDSYNEWHQSITRVNTDYKPLQRLTPIALVEVQGYVYQAKKGLADIFEQLGKVKQAAELRQQAEELKKKFEDAFWMEDVQFYAIALDEKKRQVGTITSNPGHVLFAGILDGHRENAVIRTLLSPKMFSGYGIRTMAEGEAGYNPMSYHDGSVWTHDNSIILLGLSKLGKAKEALMIMEGLIEAASHFEYDRLPELFCGYSRSFGKPVPYPVACSPQAWAAGTPLVFVQAMLGLFPNSLRKEIHLSPTLLDSMNVLKVENMAIGHGRLSLTVFREGKEIKVNIHENTTGYDVIVL
ncbi:amylo-alpha-1,6-glucosidase [Parageobacillus thermoglucosidasius]|uniref:amylo-alpha-1,6-glucosidase n=1 Tax=Parageobacillus thermoglucosidasius TaxID=1426 RepID=UPI0028001630|nr:hypothetical protein PthstB1num2_08300 [Parageobacillus thermoglucosidasius]